MDDDKKYRVIYIRLLSKFFNSLKKYLKANKDIEKKEYIDKIHILNKKFLKIKEINLNKKEYNDLIEFKKKAIEYCDNNQNFEKIKNNLLNIINKIEQEKNKKKYKKEKNFNKYSWE